MDNDTQDRTELVYELLCKLSDDVNEIKKAMGLKTTFRTDSQRWRHIEKIVSRIVVDHRGDEDKIMQEVEEKYGLNKYGWGWQSSLNPDLCFDNEFSDYKSKYMYDSLVTQAMEEIGAFNSSYLKVWLEEKEQNGSKFRFVLKNSANDDLVKEYITGVFENDNEYSCEVETYLPLFFKCDFSKYSDFYDSLLFDSETNDINGQALTEVDRDYYRFC